MVLLQRLSGESPTFQQSQVCLSIVEREQFIKTCLSYAEAEQIRRKPIALQKSGQEFVKS